MAAKINHVDYDFAGCMFASLGLILTGTQSLTYGNSVELEKTSGAAREDIGRTPGIGHADDAEWSLYESDYRALVAALGNGYMFQKFDFVVSRGDNEQPLVKDELFGCQIIKDAHDLQKGPGGLVVSITLSVMRVRKDGIDPFKA
jgi:hypothetical protein